MSRRLPALAAALTAAIWLIEGRPDRANAAMTSSHAVRVHTFHGTIFGGYFGAAASNGIVRAERFLGTHTQRVIALSQSQRDELIEARIAPPARIAIVPLGVDLGRFGTGDRVAAREALGISPSATVITAIGRLVPIKRIDRLIDAFAAARPAAPGLELVIVGDGPERAALEMRADALGVADVVRFAGWAASTTAWYAAADIVALTSDREGTPLALIEAAAAGRPVVAMTAGGVADIVLDGVTGYLVPVGDTKSFADRLVTLACDPSLRRRMGDAAPRHASAFDSARLVDDLDRLYRQAIDEATTR